MATPLYPADTGGRLRSSKMLEYLARRHRLTVLCFRTPDTTAAQLEQMRACCERLETVPWRESRKFSGRFYAELGLALCSRLPYTVSKYRSAAMRRRLRELLGTGEHELLLCDFLQPAVNCLDVPFGPRMLWQHNVEAVVMERQAAHAANSVARAYLRLEFRRLARFEGETARAFTRCVMVSDEDCRAMAERYGVLNTSSVPTGVDLDYFQPTGSESSEPGIVFTGSMDWLPNQDAVLYFVRDILPRIRRTVPAHFVIAGRNPPATIRRLEADGRVRVTGTVDDIRPYLARARVCVVPLRSGGGTRIKIFEAMAMARPVVSTRVGAEGLPVTDGRNIRLADDPEAFADTVTELLQDPDERARLGAAGRRLVSDGYGWEMAADRLSAICLDVARRGTTGCA